MKDSKGRKLRENEAQRKDGMYRYRYTVDGKRHEVCSWRLLPSDKTPAGKKEKPSLREMEEQIQKDLLSGVSISKSKITVNEQIKKYLDSKKNIGLGTNYEYHRAFKSTIEPSSLGRMEIQDVKYSDISKFYSKLLQKGFSFTYVKSFHKILQPAFQLAVDDSVISVNPCRNALKQFSGKVTKNVREPLTRKQQSRLMHFVKENYKDSRNYVILATFLGTGLRMGELMGLTWDEINLENGVINLKHQVVYGVVNNRNVFYSKEPKYNEIRTIPLQENLHKILKKYYDDTWEDSKNSGVEVGNLKGFLFWSSNGNPISPNVLYNIFYKIQVAYNKQEKQLAEVEKRPFVLLPHITPHVFRHTYCTRMAEDGMDIKALQAIMGHKDVTITMDVYNHVSKERVMLQLPILEQLEL